MCINNYLLTKLIRRMNMKQYKNLDGINKILLIILNIKYIHHRNISYVIMAWLVLFLNNYDLNKIDSYRVVHR